MKGYFTIGDTDYMPLIIDYGQKFVVGVLILAIGLWVAGLISRTVQKVMAARGFDAALQSFLSSMIGIVLKVLVVITALGTLGIEMTSFVAILGAASLAIGMALSGTLQNFAGGVMILAFKPFKVGNYIEAQGYAGTVAEIQIFNTILKTPDNKTIIIPNGGLSTGSMVNYSTEDRRRVDWAVRTGYGDDVEKAKQVLLKIMNDDARILKDPAPFVAISELGDSSVKFAVRGWAEAVDYWDVFFDLNERIYTEFRKEGLSIPFPQMGVHVQNIPTGIAGQGTR